MSRVQLVLAPLGLTDPESRCCAEFPKSSQVGYLMAEIDGKFSETGGRQAVVVIVVTRGVSQARDVVCNFVEVSRQSFCLDAQFYAHQNTNKKFSQFLSDEAVFAAGICPNASRHIITPVE